MESKEYYLKELLKLKTIMEQDTGSGFIARSYVQEKLNQIITGVGIGLHSTLQPLMEKEYERIKELDN